MWWGFSAVFSNIVTPEQLDETSSYFAPILGISLMAAIVVLGAPLDYHLILGAGLYTFVYIAARAIGKYFGARSGAKQKKDLNLQEKSGTLHHDNKIGDTSIMKYLRNVMLYFS